jgi:hypothetical protein
MLAERMRELIINALDGIKLKILVFGPQVHTPSAEVRVAKLQAKRVDIRSRLEGEGHIVRYAEELVDPTIEGPSGEAFFQELVIMREYDLIVNIVDQPGSIAEATTISLKPLLARKAVLFLDEAYNQGFVASTCRNAADMGAHFRTFRYPADLDECHMLGHVMERVRLVQKMKYLL